MTNHTQIKPLSATRLQEISNRCREASTGPWITGITANVGDNWMICSLGNSGIDAKDYIVTTDHVHCSEFSGDAKTDADFIAHARQDMPDLLNDGVLLRAVIQQCIESLSNPAAGRVVNAIAKAREALK